jgi:hypothetical protein
VATGLTEEEEMERAIQMSLQQEQEQSGPAEKSVSLPYAGSAPTESAVSKEKMASVSAGSTVFGFAGVGASKQQKQAGFCASEVSPEHYSCSL